jgi:hypothetical protein
VFKGVIIGFGTLSSDEDTFEHSASLYWVTVTPVVTHRRLNATVKSKRYCSIAWRFMLESFHQAIGQISLD